MIADRFEVDNPELQEMVESYPRKKMAFRRAFVEAVVRQHHMVVCDLMARRGQPDSWRIEPNNRIIVCGNKPLVPDPKRDDPRFGLLKPEAD